MKIKKYINWEECSYEDYCRVSIKYGYNNESSPFFIKFAIEQGAKLDFFIFKKKGEALGACCVDNGWICNDHKNPKCQTKSFPVPRNSILLPFDPYVKFVLPFRTKSLSVLNKGVMNSSFSLFSKRHVAVVRNSNQFSNKTRSTRNRESRKFIKDGGRFENISKFSWEEISDIYSMLYKKRRPEAGSLSVEHIAFIKEFQKNFFGDIAFIDDLPVALQLNLLSESATGCFVDFINIGYDTSINTHSLGTLCMWRNLLLAETQAEKVGLPLTYSFGMMSGDYKSRWCEPTKVGRALWIDL